MNSQDLDILQQVRHKIKESDVMKDLFKKHNVDIDLVDLIPMRFGELPVSARTYHGLITFSDKLKQNSIEDTVDKVAEYASHEIKHVLDQTTGDAPTQGSNAEDYLDNPYEEKAFQTQTKFITEKDGPQAAEDYIDKVMDHHDVPNNERENKKDDLLRTSSNQMKLPFHPKKEKPPVKVKEIQDFIKKLDEGNFEVEPRAVPNAKFPEWEKEYRLKKLKEILDAIEKTAGMLKTPPDFPIQEAKDWLDNITASRVLENIQSRINIYNAQLKDNVENSKHFKVLQDNFDKISSFFFDDGGNLIISSKDLPPELEIKVKVIKHDDDNYDLIVNNKVYNSLSNDQAEQVLWNKESGFLTILAERYKNQIDHLKKNEDIISSPELKEWFVEQSLLIEDCKKYSISKVKDTEIKQIKDITIIYGVDKESAHIPKEIDMEGYVGLFLTNKKTIHLICDPETIETVEDFHKQLKEIHRTLIHELRHKHGYDLSPKGGPPPKSISHGIFEIEDKQDYYLQDDEFYPQLQDEITWFRQKWDKAPKEIQIEAFKALFGLNYIKNKIYPMKKSPFFNTLQKLAPGKWKKALVEFYKGVFGG